MKLILVRHGESEGNKIKIVQGQIEANLSENGKKQAKALADALKNEKIDIIFCSTMKRARQTLDEVLIHHKNLEILFDENIIEMHFGKFQGGSRELLHKVLDAYKAKYEDFKPEGGESFNELIDRTKTFLKRLENYEDKTILVISHGRVMRTILSILLNQPLEDMMKTWIENATINEIELKEGKAKLIKINEKKHLEVA